MKQTEKITNAKWGDTIFNLGDKVEWKRQHRHPTRYIEIIQGTIVEFPHYNLARLKVNKMRDRLVPIRLLKSII